MEMPRSVSIAGEAEPSGPVRVPVALLAESVTVRQGEERA